jgi:proline iminopeptidase
LDEVSVKHSAAGRNQLSAMQNRDSILSRRSLLALSGAALLTACSSSKPEELHLADLPVLPPHPDESPDGARMIDIDGKHKVWTKRIGSASTKALLLHGGPGATHSYLECFEKVLPQAGIEFYYYDQLGCGFSDKPDDPSLWTLDRFVDEVEQVRGKLGLENFILYGHSFGAMLAIEYALKYPTTLKKLVLSNMTASVASYEAYIHELRLRLAPDIQAKLASYEKEGKYDDPQYQTLVSQFLDATYLCRLDPLPEPVERAFKMLSKPVYNTMQGPNEFVITGNLKTWDRWGDLPKIMVPTLAIGARWDEMNPVDIEREAHIMPHGKYAFCANGSHFCMWDDQVSYFQQLIPFLKA